MIFGLLIQCGILGEACKLLIIWQKDVGEEISRLVDRGLHLLPILFLAQVDQGSEIAERLLRTSLNNGAQCRYSIDHGTILEDVQVELTILILLQKCIVLIFLLLHQLFSLLE